MPNKKIKGYIAVSPKDKELFVKEEFKGEVTDIPIRFPKELGAEHPFDFEDVEKVYKKVGIVAGGINKITNAIMGDFTIKTKKENVQTLLESFLKDTNFNTIMRPWIREGLLKGNGFMEIDLENAKLRVMNANQMYVKRNTKGKVLEYNQWIGKTLKNFHIKSNKINNFKPDQIAHLPINKIPNDAYGIGIIWPNERVIENIVNQEEDKSKLTKRKAGQPIHVKVGVPGEAVQSTDIDDFRNKLQFMNNRTEWVTDANVTMEVLRFDEITKNLTDSMYYDFRMFIGGIEVPEVLFGSGQLNEGIAKVQREEFKAGIIRSLREQVESVIEEKIFKPYLNANGFDEDVEFIWDLPTEEDKNQRIDQIQKLLNTFGISENLKRGLELELARVMDMEDVVKVLRKPEVGLDDKKEQEEKEREDQFKNPESKNPEREKEEKIKQPEVPGAKPSAKEISEFTDEEMNSMQLREFVNLKEIHGFNYSDYLLRILRRVKLDNFENLLATTDEELSNGMLPRKEVEKLRIILRDGFKKNRTIRQIENEIKESLDLKDRLRDEKVILSSESRPNAIARTETVRLANLGLVDTYKENDIKQVRFLAALSDRTCPICEGLNSRIFNINELREGENQPPIHTACRCSLLSVVE
jgi:SPP1 gp7 family putative phage head morphogenesis protein